MEESYEEHVETVAMACRDDELSRELEGLAMLPLQNILAASMQDTVSAQASKDEDDEDDEDSGKKSRSGASTRSDSSKSSGSSQAESKKDEAPEEPFEPKKCSVCKMSLGKQMHLCTQCRFAACRNCRYSRRTVRSNPRLCIALRCGAVACALTTLRGRTVV